MLATVMAVEIYAQKEGRIDELHLGRLSKRTLSMEYVICENYIQEYSYTGNRNSRLAPRKDLPSPGKVVYVFHAIYVIYPSI